MCLHACACTRTYTCNQWRRACIDNKTKTSSCVGQCRVYFFSFCSFLLLLRRVSLCVLNKQRSFVWTGASSSVSHRLNRMKFSQLSLPYTHHSAVGRCLCGSVWGWSGVGDVKRFIFYLLRCQRTAAAESTVPLEFAC